MKNYSLKSILSISLSIILLSLVIIYSNSNKLINFNNIIINNSNIIDEESLYKYINYNPDSINFYSKNDINEFKQRIYSLKKNGLIKSVRLSYSIPNKILVDISNNQPIYLIESKSHKFILDNSGFIYDTKFLSNFSYIPNIKLNFSNEQFYESWYFEDYLDLKNLFNNINKSRFNNKYLLDAFEILHWFKNSYLYTHLDSVSITDNTINAYLGQTKILFSKNNKNIKNQINKIDQIVNNQDLLDSLKIDDLTKLKEIKLFFDNQIIIKS